MAGEILEHATIDSDAALADFIRSNCITICHPVGTAKMGPDSNKEAVVDQYCRVHSVEGLRVVDASVMPNIVRANTNLTCIMIAEGVADWMRAESLANKGRLRRILTELFFRRAPGERRSG